MAVDGTGIDFIVEKEEPSGWMSLRAMGEALLGAGSWVVLSVEAVELAGEVVRRHCCGRPGEM